MKITFKEVINLMDGYGDDSINLYITEDGRKFIISGYYENMPNSIDNGYTRNESTYSVEELLNNDYLSVRESLSSVEEIVNDHKCEDENEEEDE